MKLLISIDLQDLCIEILNFKYDSSIKPKLIPEYLLLPRNSSQIQSDLVAFQIEQNSSTLYKSTYNYSLWQGSRPIDVQMTDIYTMVEWNHYLFVFNETGQIVCIDMNTLVVNSIPDIPKRRKKYAVVVHDDCIYVVGGTEPIDLQHRPATIIEG